MLKLLLSVSLLALGGCIMQPKPVRTSYVAPPPRVVVRQPVAKKPAPVVRKVAAKPTVARPAPFILQGGDSDGSGGDSDGSAGGGGWS